MDNGKFKLQNVVKLVVLGEAVAKGRPKFARRGKFVQTYTPEKTVNYETLVKLSYQEQCDTFFDGSKPLYCKIKIFVRPPKSIPKYKIPYLNVTLFPLKKPDLDNCVKSIWDALRNVAYPDDTVFQELAVEKYYCNEPSVEVIIAEKVPIDE